jgi:hypothetical protein
MTSTSADRSRADAPFALAKRAPEEACAGRSVIVDATERVARDTLGLAAAKPLRSAWSGYASSDHSPIVATFED